jgi:hypothetical protein
MTKNELTQFIEQYEQGTVEVSPGVTYNMRDVNNESYRLYNARFESGEFEENGFRRVFMRKMWVVYRTLIQGSDLDMKHLNIRSLNGVKVRLVGLLRMAFYSHLLRTFFGEFVDKVMAEMCWFGSSIVKRYDGKVDTVDLRNYITEPNIRNPQERRHAELVFYTYDQMVANKDRWKEHWDEIENVWEAMQKDGESKFKVVEFWTWGEAKGKDGVHKICVKYLDNTLTEQGQNQDEWTPYIELERFKTPFKKRRTSKKLREKLGEYEEMFPYEQFDLFTVPGRGQGMGCGELIAAPQMVYNELFNNKRKLDLKALMGISVHTATQGVNGLTTLSQEAVSNLDTGTIITLAPGEKFDQMQVDMKTGDWSVMEEKIYELMRQIIGITAQGTGEEVPASTSATQARINQQVANTVFDYTRERMHHGIQKLFNNGYSEDIINEIDEEELTAIIGDPTQLQELDKFLLDNAMNAWAIQVKEQTGMYPTEEEFAAAYEQVHQDLMAHGDMRWPEIKKDLLKDMEFYIDFDMTNEAVDTKGRFDALTAMKNDPTSTKSKAKIEDEILSLQGLNPRQYDKSPEEVKQEQEAKMIEMQAEGGMMAPPQPVTV